MARLLRGVVGAIASRIRGFSSRPDSPSGSIATFAESVVGQLPEPSLGVIVDWYRRDAYVRYAVDAYANRIASRYYLTARDPDALGFVNRFMRLNRFGQLNRLIARDVVLSGNAFLNTVPARRITSLYLLPLSSVSSIIRDESGEVRAYV